MSPAATAPISVPTNRRPAGNGSYFCERVSVDGANRGLRTHCAASLSGVKMSPSRTAARYAASLFAIGPQACHNTSFNAVFCVDLFRAFLAREPETPGFIALFSSSLPHWAVASQSPGFLVQKTQGE